MKLKIVTLCLASACYPDSGDGTVDTATEIYITPSIKHKTVEIIDSVVGLNRLVGTRVFSVYYTSSNQLRDGQAIIRQVEHLPCDERSCFIGYTVRNSQGVLIELLGTANVSAIQHEILHAVGLGHHPDPENIMYEFVGGWKLTEEQIDQVLQHGE
jgi:hypothetical protein